MTEIGFALSSEEHGPRDLVRLAQQAEDAGFSFAMISDRIHPWIDRQGNSSFVWSVLGAIAMATDTLKVGTGVTCPIIRTHPVVIAHASATVAEMMPGRFWLGLGTGEALNEHVTGAYWPPIHARREMLKEAIEIIRALWTGDNTDYEGEYYEVVDARLYTAPPEPPPILIATGGPESATMAGEVGDGIVCTAPDSEVIEAFEEAGGKRKPRFGKVTVCYADSERDARRMAHEIWPTSGLRGELNQELPLPRHFEQAAKNVTEDMIADVMTCGPDPEKHIAAMRQYIDAGFDHVYVHNVGSDQDRFFQFFAREVMPHLATATSAA